MFIIRGILISANVAKINSASLCPAIKKLNNTFDKRRGIFIHGHVVYLSVCINGLFSLKTNIGY